MTPWEIRFAADGMLLSLGAWLRLLGFDCTGAAGRTARELFEEAVADDRVFLTRNLHLRDCLPHLLLERVHIHHILPEHLPAQLREVVARFGLEPEEFAFTRCVRCNVPLTRAPAPADLPATVRAQQTEFWRCPRCAQVFWRGTHVTNSLARLRRWLA